MNLPGFISEVRPLIVTNYRESVLDQPPYAVVLPAEFVSGGPSNVPSGYERTCKRVPYTVCVGDQCWTEYGWVCTYRPLSRS